jgi:hypothetical protein
VIASWGTQPPAADRYAEGWRDCALSLAADFDRRMERPGPAIAIGALYAAAEVARQHAEAGPPSSAQCDDMDPLFDISEIPAKEAS